MTALAKNYNRKKFHLNMVEAAIYIQQMEKISRFCKWYSG